MESGKGVLAVVTTLSFLVARFGVCNANAKRQS
jgi:hypothetical protein